MSDPNGAEFNLAISRALSAGSLARRGATSAVLIGLMALGFSLPAASQGVRPEVVASGLANPWGMAFLPEGGILVTERAGRLRLVSSTGQVSAPVQGLPDIDDGGQGGLLDVLLDTDFAKQRTIYFCFSEPASGQAISFGRGNSTALARATLSADGRALQGVQIIFSQKPKFSSSAHFGCRIVEGRSPDGRADGTLFLTLGDRFSRRDDAQTLNNHHGKVIRIRKDGSVPADNPLVGRAGALPEIWSWGHRNVQGATLAPDGRLWTHEHGPQGGDEINIARAGVNYGWPVITYGKNYGGSTIGEGLTTKEGLEQPLHHWTPSIAPSGMTFLSSDRYGPAWRGNLFVGSLKFGYLHRIELSEPFKGRVVREHKLLEGGERVRDVRQGPDGLLYVLTDSANGRLLRLQPGGL